MSLVVQNAAQSGARLPARRRGRNPLSLSRPNSWAVVLGREFEVHAAAVHARVSRTRCGGRAREFCRPRLGEPCCSAMQFLRIVVVFSAPNVARSRFSSLFSSKSRTTRRGLPPCAFDPVRFFLIKAVDIGVVFRFLRLYESVVDGLVIGRSGLRGESVPFLRQGQRSRDGSLRGPSNVSCRTEALLREIPNVVLHFFAMSW